MGNRSKLLALLVSIGYGICGVAIDGDHLFPLHRDARWLHLPLLIAGGVVLCGCLALFGGFYFKMVLKKRYE